MPAKPRLPVRLTPAAAGDLEAAFAYVSERDRSAASELLQRLEEAVGRLADFPELGVALQPEDFELLRPGARFIVVEPYMIFYRVGDLEIIVLRVLHSRRDHLAELLESLGE